MPDAPEGSGPHAVEPSSQRTALLELAECMASFGHWQLDLKEGRLFWSDGVFRIHGVTRDDYTPDIDSAIDFYHPDDAARVATLIDSAISDRRPFEFEFRLIRPDGVQRIVHSRALVQMDASDTVVSVFGVVQDVTGERDVQLKLEQQVERFDLAMLGAGVGLWDWDVDADELHLSERAARLTGLRSPCTSDEFLDAVVVEDQAGVRAPFKEQRNPLDVEFRVCLGNREIKWLRLRGEALRDQQENVKRMAGSLQDVSASKRHNALREAIAELGETQGLNCNDRVGRLLSLGYRFLDLDFALVVAIDQQGVVVSHVNDPSGRVMQGARIAAEPATMLAALRTADFLTDRDECLRLLMPLDCAGPHGAGDMIALPVRIGRRPEALAVFASGTSNGHIFGETARSVVRVLAQVIGYEMTCGDAIS
ncbi:MAG: PAS domain-containing protein [Gammaproteobacteria bacterium]